MKNECKFYVSGITNAEIDELTSKLDQDLENASWDEIVGFISEQYPQAKLIRVSNIADKIRKDLLEQNLHDKKKMDESLVNAILSHIDETVQNVNLQVSVPEEYKNLVGNKYLFLIDD